MTPRQLVDRGLELRAEIKAREAELKIVEAALKEAGLKASAAGRVEDLKDEDREGRRWLAAGTERIVPVIFTADMIVGSFAFNSVTHRRITEGPGGDHFLDFFKLTRTYENKFADGKKFRAAVNEALGPVAPGFIMSCKSRDKAGVPKSDIKIAWDAAEPVT